MVYRVPDLQTGSGRKQSAGRRQICKVEGVPGRSVGLWTGCWLDTSLVVRSHAALIAVTYRSSSAVARSNRQNGALIQCWVSGGGAPSNFRIVWGGIPSLPAISSGVGSRPIT
jgi:hypothetical protein